jgi:hypothetical protein
VWGVAVSSGFVSGLAVPSQCGFTCLHVLVVTRMLATINQHSGSGRSIGSPCTVLAIGFRPFSSVLGLTARQMFEDIGVRSNMLLWLITFNVPHGPYESDSRFQEARKVMDDVFANHEPRDCPLFKAMLPDMLNDAEYADLDAEEDAEQAVWQRLKEQHPWHTKGSKLVKGRFMAFSRAARREVKHMTARGFGYLMACMEMNFITDKSLDKMVLLKAAGDEAAEMKTTSSKLETVEEKTVRKTGANNMMLAAIQCNNVDAKRLLRMVLELVAPSEEWHSEQNKRLRSTDESITWMIEQICGGFFAYLRDTIRTISSPASLAAVPFVLPGVGRVVEAEDNDVFNSFREDHLASLMADGALQLACLRMCRCLWMLRGWPSRLVVALRDDDLAQKAIQSFR